MEPTQELIDDIYREKVLRARRGTPESRFAAGPQLFEMVCEFAKAGIRAQHPEADEDRVIEILRARLAWRKRVEWRR